MSEHDDLNVDFGEAFKSKFAQNAKTAERIKAERRAGRTPKERNRATKPGLRRDYQINVRGTIVTKELLDKLADHLKGSQADVIEQAIAALANSYKITSGSGG
jgi:hypothetical protein